MPPSPLPTLLYHYTDVHGLRGIFESQAIWASNIRYLNDSRELDHAVMIGQMVIRGKAETVANPQEKALLKALSGVTLGDRVDVFVTSFCADDGDSLSQWRGYCPNGAGYSIGFVAKDLDTAAGVQVISLVQCLYKYEDQCELITHVLNKIMSSAEWTRALEEFENSGSYQTAAQLWRREFSPAAPIIKHPGFHEEREWRLITGPISPDHYTWNVRPGRSILIPYVPILLAVNSPIFSFKDIVVGPTPHMDLAQQAVGDWITHKNMCEWHLGTMDWEIRNSKIPYRNW